MMKNKSRWILDSFLILLLLALFFGYSKRAYLYSFQADYFFRKNNIEKAQEFYEKTFNLGLSTSKQREIYVNTIITSPLTIEMQEKLMNFIALPIDDVAKLKGEIFINDLRRAINREYPDNYIKNAVYNQRIVRWSNCPIKYSFANKEIVPSYFVKEIENALLKWERETDGVILFEEENINPNIVIRFSEDNPAEDEYKKHVVAYTVPTINANMLDRMEIIFYTKTPSQKYYQPSQIYNTALHEIVHALGCMGHSDDKQDIMYLSRELVSDDDMQKEDLSVGDINTIKLLYKIKPEITNSKKTKAEYLPLFVLGTSEDISDEKIEEARTYIRKASNLPSGYIDLAEGFIAIKDYKSALKSLQQALLLAETEEMKAMVYYNLAVTYFYMDDFEDAKQKLQESILLADSEEKHYLLAEIYVREGNEQGAIEEYQELLKKNPNNVEYVVSLTNIYVLKRDFIKARKVLKNYFKLNPEEKKNPRFQPYGIIKFGL